jgi:hypothetical protein
VDCVCPAIAPATLQPTSLESIVPGYLDARRSKDHYQDYRNRAYYP